MSNGEDISQRNRTGRFGGRIKWGRSLYPLKKTVAGWFVTANRVEPV